MPEPIEAPRAAARRSKIKKHKTVKDSQFTLINHWKEIPVRMDHEIGHSHFSRKNKGRNARKKSDRQKDASEKLKNSS